MSDATQRYMVTAVAGPKVAGRNVKVGDVLDLTDNEARSELLSGAIALQGSTPVLPAPATLLPTDILTITRGGIERRILVSDLAAFIQGAGGSTPTVAAPVNTSVPSVSGTARVGQTLNASQGSWSGSPTSYAYQWKRAGAAISGATSAIYSPVAADVGNVLTVTVTATNAGGAASATSAATSAVTAAAATGASPGTISSDFSDPNTILPRV